MKKVSLIFLILEVVCASVATAQDRTPAQTLEACGISASPKNLVEFLEKGFPPDSHWGKALSEPVPATQLLIFAMEELAKKQSRIAVPVLIRTAHGDYTEGQKSLVDYDCSALARSRQGERKKLLYEYIRFNAVNALGLIGDPLALPILQETFDELPPGRLKIRAALGMASLGYGGGIGYLVKQIRGKNRILASEATQTLSLITGMELDYGQNTPISRRKRTVKKVIAWWKENGETYRPSGAEVLKRRLNRKPPSPTRLHSVRELIMAASNYGDIDNRFKSRDAREQLAALGASLLPHLHPLCLDREEDLNIRIEALRRFAALAPYEVARAVLKKARHDNNPEIRSLAKNLLKQIKRKKR